MAINQLYLIKSGENSFVEETGTIISISGGQVGIGTSAPESYLHITGSTQIDGDLTVKGNFSTVNETTVQIDDKNIELGVGSNSDMLSNGGGITLKGFTDKTITWLNYNDAWNFNTNIYVDGSGNFASGVNIEGEAVFNSDLNVSGNGNFASGVNIEGEAVFNSDLNVSGNGNFASGVNIEGEAVFNSDLNVSGNGNFASGVNIEGEAVFNSDLNVSGNGNFASGVNIEGEAVFNSDLNVSGNGNFASGVNIEGEAVFNSDLNVSGNGNFASGVNIEGEAVFNSDLNVSGNGNFASGVNIEGEAVFNSDLNVSGNGNFASGVNIEGEAVFNSDLNVSGNGNFASGVNIEGEAVFNSDLNVSGNGNFASGVNIEGEAVFNSDLNVSGNGNFASGLFFKNQPVLTGIESDLSKWKINDTPSSDTYNVNISGDGQDYLFSEDFEGLDPEIKIKSGGTLVFSNIGQGHALAVKNNENVDVSVESNNQTIFAPTQTGIYTYYCQSHPEVMKGQIHVLNNQEIFYNDGDVGIGTDSPAYSLDVVGKGNFSEGLYVNGNSVLTGSTSVLGKWEDGAEAGEIFYNAGNVGIGTDNPSYNLEVKGSGNFSEGLYVNGNSVLTGSTSDLGKWGDGAEAGEIFYKAGNVGIGTDNPSVNLDVVGKTQVSESFSVSNIFSIDDQGRVGGQTPFSNDVIQWDGLKWVAAQSAGGGSNGGGEVPSALLYNLSSGESIQQVSFGQTFNVIPRIATNLEINGEGSIIPYIISGLSTSGYNAVFAKKIPNNNYRIHTVFGGKDVYWETGVSNSLVYNDGDVNLLRNLSVSGSLTVQGSPVLTGSVSDLGKWEDSVTAGEIYYNGGNVGIGTIDPAYSLHVNGTIYNENGGINVANKFNVSTLGAVGGQSPDFNEVIKWDGTKWIAGSAPGGGATSSSEAPSAFDTWLNQGSAIQAISFVDAPEGGYQSIPSISTDVEIIEGDIIPYAISGVSTTGYYAVFSDPIPTANNYKIHTTFGGKEVYWQTGAGGNSIYYDGDDVSVDNLTVGGNLTVNGTQTIVNTETMEIEDHNLVIAANTGHNQLTAEYPGAGGAYAGILWGTGDAGAASPVSLTYQSNKGFAFEGGNVGIGTTSPDETLHVSSLAGPLVAIFEHTDGGSSELAFQDTNQQNQIRIGTADSGFRVFTADEERMRIDSNGNVGIGTTTPASNHKLHIKHTETANFRIERNKVGHTNSQNGYFQITAAEGSNLIYSKDLDGNAKNFVIDGGNVGIGTTNPSVNLDLKKASNDGGATLRLRSAAVLDDYKTVGSIEYFSDDASTDSTGLVGSIDVINAGTTWRGDGNNAAMTFNLIQGLAATTSPVEAMRIDSDGNVGIGTTNPSFKLHLNKSTGGGNSSSYTGGILIENTDTANTGECIIAFKNAGNAGTGANFWWSGLNQDNYFAIGYGTSVTNAVTKLAIDTSGNVGIGTTDPDGKLEIEKDSYGTLDAGQGHMVLDTVGVAREKGKGPFINFRVPTTSSTSEDMANIGAVCSDSTASSRKADLVFWTRNNTINERMRIDSSGNVGIGTTDPSASRLDVWQTEHASDSCIKTVRPGTADRKHLVFFNDNGIVGDIKTNGLETAYNTSSDYRLKENVVELTDALDRVCQLKPSRFNFIADKNKTVDGFLAHEVQEIVPEAISGEKDAIDEDGKPDYQGIDQSKLVPLLTKAIQEQQQIIDQLKSQNESLAAQNVDFESRISKLEQQ